MRCPALLALLAALPRASGQGAATPFLGWDFDTFLGLYVAPSVNLGNFDTGITLLTGGNGTFNSSATGQPSTGTAVTLTGWLTTLASNASAGLQLFQWVPGGFYERVDSVVHHPTDFDKMVDEQSKTGCSSSSI